MPRESRPGPKPKRLYLRSVRFGPSAPGVRPAPRLLRAFVSNLDRVGRLVAHGEVTDPPGDLLVFRAADRPEADRILRSDPLRGLEEGSYEVHAWHPTDTGSGVNLDPPPARGAGRLTSLDRITVVVRDQVAASAWYRDVLGLGVRGQDPTTGVLELSLGKGAAALSLVAPQLTWGEPFFSETVARIGAATGIAFRTDSVPALELRLRHAGVRITQPARAEPWGELILRFADPDGNEFLAHQPVDPRTRSTDLQDEVPSPSSVAPRPRRSSASPRA